MTHPHPLASSVLPPSGDVTSGGQDRLPPGNLSAGFSQSAISAAAILWSIAVLGVIALAGLT